MNPVSCELYEQILENEQSDRHEWLNELENVRDHVNDIKDEERPYLTMQLSPRKLDHSNGFSPSSTIYKMSPLTVTDHTEMSIQMMQPGRDIFASKKSSRTPFAKSMNDTGESTSPTSSACVDWPPVRSPAKKRRRSCSRGVLGLNNYQPPKKGTVEYTAACMAYAQAQKYRDVYSKSAEIYNSWHVEYVTADNVRRCKLPEHYHISRPALPEHFKILFDTVVVTFTTDDVLKQRRRGRGERPRGVLRFWNASPVGNEISVLGNSWLHTVKHLNYHVEVPKLNN